LRVASCGLRVTGYEFQCPNWETGENGVLLAQVYTDFHEFIATKKDKKQKRDKKTAKKVLYKVLYKHVR